MNQKVAVAAVAVAALVMENQAGVLQRLKIDLQVVQVAHFFIFSNLVAM